MNLKDIADFLDLVSNPEKYKKYLNELVAEQERFNKVIATVGEATELGNLRKEFETAQAVYKEKIAKDDAARQEEIAAEIAAIVRKKEDVEKLNVSAHARLQEADAKLAKAEAITNTHANKEKELRKLEEVLLADKVQLGAMVTEYNEKLAKLRSVMS